MATVVPAHSTSPYNIGLFPRQHTRMNFESLTLGTVALLILAPLLVWRIYSRVNKLMVRQQSIMARHWTGTLVFLAMVLVTLSEVVSRDAMLMASWAVGTAFGIGWAVFAFKRTRLEMTPEGYFYTPVKPLGMLFAMLFAARVLYLLLEVYANQGAMPVQRLTESPLTVLAITLMAGYFGTISAGLLRWRLRHDQG